MHKPRNAQTYKNHILTWAKNTTHKSSNLLNIVKERNQITESIKLNKQTHQTIQVWCTHIAMESGIIIEDDNVSPNINRQWFQPSDDALPPRRASCLRRKRHLNFKQWLRTSSKNKPEVEYYIIIYIYTTTMYYDYTVLYNYKIKYYTFK